MSDKKPDTNNTKEKDQKATSSENKPTKAKQSKNRDSSSEKTPVFNSVIPPKQKNKSKSHKGISRASAVFLSLLAALTGAAIGWLGPTMFKNTGVTDALNQTVLNVKSELRTENEKIKSLENELKTAQEKIAQNTKQFTKLTNTLSLQEARFSELVANNTNENYENLLTRLDTLKARIDAQEALSGTKSGSKEMSEGAKVLLARLSSLETQIVDLQKNIQQVESKPEFPMPSTEPINLPETQIEGKLSLEDRTNILNTLIDSFPKTEMLEAVNAQNKIASKKPSWLQNILSKHVKVRDDNTPALTTINAAENALKAGQIEKAILQVKKLNPPVRVLAKEWIVAAKEADKTLNPATTNKDER